MRFVFLLKEDDGTVYNFLPSAILGIIIANAFILAIILILTLTDVCK